MSYKERGARMFKGTRKILADFKEASKNMTGGDVLIGLANLGLIGTTSVMVGEVVHAVAATAAASAATPLAVAAFGAAAVPLTVPLVATAFAAPLLLGKMWLYNRKRDFGF
jgi:ABC-type spermidine/putrescine transport system permease subunit II